MDEPLIQSLYAQMYQDGVAGEERLRMLSLHELVSVTAPGGEAVAEAEAVVRDLTTGALRTLRSAAVVLATGYRQRRRIPLLAPVEPYLVHDEAGDYRLGRDFELHTEPGFRPTIFLQGFGEDTHGLGEAQLSNMAVRAGIIVDRLAGKLTEKLPV